MHLRCDVDGNMMKHMAHPAMATHRTLAISLDSSHSLIGSVASFGQEISSSMIWTPMMGRPVSNSG
jgi:hypothetical protein